MKFSVVTPSYNLDKWLPQTIESVISQSGDFEIEYIVVDGGSSDKSLSIAEEYKKKIESGAFPIACRKVSMTCVVEKETGMYEAINRGFARATGNIYAWINSDDVYEAGAFKAIKEAVERYPDIDWIKGITSTIDENGSVIQDGSAKIYRQDWIRDGIYGQEAYFIEQDSVFWRASLWKSAGPIPAELRSAGDYWLWMSFARFSPLWTLKNRTSCFRKREGQISKDVSKYKAEQWTIRPARSLKALQAKAFFTVQSRVTALYPKMESLFITLYPIFFMTGKHAEYIEMGKEPKRAIARSYKV
ncbi:MAG: glycosyltransferase [Candidatus Taylorbacteria bacterium]|nr:glycosyltransferase [Candidatus Taylorbacteria bacterium]